MEAMMRYGLIAICAATILSGPAFADPWKDESGNGRWRDDRGSYGEGRGYDEGRGGYGERRRYGEGRGYGEGRRGGYGSYNMDREYKEEYRRDNCKVERKWERDGGYKEETKCKGYR
jgi:hypothetical protein